MIPVDAQQAIRQVQLDPSDAHTYREIVGGPLEIVTFDRPRACLYVNEDGKLEAFAVINARATVLAWAHNSALRGRDPIVGDALLVGPPDKGYDTSVPEELTELLFAARAFKVEIQVHGDEAWYGNEQVHGDVFAAYAAGIDLAQRWSHVVNIRVVPVTVAAG